MKLFTNKKQLQTEIRKFNNISFVPTMGALHKGHESIIRKSVKGSGKTLVRIFLNPNQFNKVLKNIYSTNFFENVSLSLDNGVLTIKVKEYPIIQSIIINGVKAKKFKEEIYERITLKEKNPYNKLLLKNDLNNIKNSFKRSGYYFVQIKLEEKINENNT